MMALSLDFIFLNFSRKRKVEIIRVAYIAIDKKILFIWRKKRIDEDVIHTNRDAIKVGYE